MFTDGSSWVATVDHDGDDIGDASTTVTIQSGEELVWQEGAAGEIGDPQHEVLAGDVVDGDAYELMFGNHEVGALGLTPGFWCNHLYLWDGNEQTDGPLDGQGRSLADKLVEAGVVEDSELLDNLPQHNGADVNVDGGPKDLVFEFGGQCLVIEWDDAQEIICSSTKKAGDKLHDFTKFAITTLLNDSGVPDFNAPDDLIGDIADWLIQYGPTTFNAATGCYVLNYNNSTESGKDGFGPGGNTVIKASSAAWQTGDADTPSGAEIFQAMVDLTDSSSNNLLVSLNEAFVMTTVNEGDHFGLVNSTTNDPDGYLYAMTNSLAA